MSSQQNLPVLGNRAQETIMRSTESQLKKPGTANILIKHQFQGDQHNFLKILQYFHISTEITKFRNLGGS